MVLFNIAVYIVFTLFNNVNGVFYLARSILEGVSICATEPKCRAIAVETVSFGRIRFRYLNDDYSNGDSSLRIFTKTIHRNDKRVTSFVQTAHFLLQRQSHFKDGQRCSCILPKYGEPYSGNGDFIMAGTSVGRHLKLQLSKPAFSPRFVTIDINFDKKVTKLFLDLKNCRFLFLRRTYNKTRNLASLCLDGKREETLLTGRISAFYYDHVHGYILFTEYIPKERRSHLKIYHEKEFPEGYTFSKTRITVYEQSVSGHAQSKTLLICGYKWNRGGYGYSCNLYNYSVPQHVTKKFLLAVKTDHSYLSIHMISKDTFFISYNAKTVRIYNTRYENTSTVATCPGQPSRKIQFIQRRESVLVACYDKHTSSVRRYSIHGKLLRQFEIRNLVFLENVPQNDGPMV